MLRVQESAETERLVTRLHEALRTGDPLDLTPDPTSPASWGASRIIPAHSLRHALLHPPVDHDPRGLIILRARIQGCLHLEYADINVPLTLRGCHLPDGIAGEGCSIPQLALPDSRSKLIDLDKAHVHLDLDLTGVTVKGQIRLLRAHIGGAIELSRAVLINDSGPALNASSATIDQSALLNKGFTASGTGCGGAINLVSAHIGGRLEMTGAKLTNTDGPALNANGATFDQGVFLSNGFEATGYGNKGAVDLVTAHIGGAIELSRAVLINDSGPALNASGATIDQSALLNNGFTASGTDDDGAVHLIGAHIGGQLAMDTAELANTSGPALNASGATIDQGVFLNDGFTASGTGEEGAVNLVGVHIGDELDLTGATLANTIGPALQSRALRVDGALVAGGPDHRLRMHASGCGPWGVVRLAQARIGGRLVLTRAHIEHLARRAPDDTSLLGPGLNAPDLSVAGSMLIDQCCISGSGTDPAVRVVGARIDGELSLRGTHIDNPSGAALSATHAHIERGLLLDGAKLIGQAGSMQDARGVVRLVGTTVGGNLVLDADLITAATTHRQLWAVEDLTYTNTPIGPRGARCTPRAGSASCGTEPSATPPSPTGSSRRPPPPPVMTTKPARC